MFRHWPHIKHSPIRDIGHRLIKNKLLSKPVSNCSGSEEEIITLESSWARRRDRGRERGVTGVAADKTIEETDESKAGKARAGKARASGTPGDRLLLLHC